MAIFPYHVRFYEEVFGIPGFFSKPTLQFGFQDILMSSVLPPAPRLRGRALAAQLLRRMATLMDSPAPLAKIREKLAAAGTAKPHAAPPPPRYHCSSLSELLRKDGVMQIEIIDLFDPRATLRYDMNYAVPTTEHEKYATVIDIGSLEHVFDTRQCFENCLRMVRTGGLYFLHTPVNGFFGHGLHTFNPCALRDGLQLNGFEIEYEKYSTSWGEPVADPSHKEDIILWIVGRKRRAIERFVCPQQERWIEYYDRAKIAADQ